MATDAATDAGTVAEAVRTAARTLAECSDSPRLDAELLLGQVLGLSRSALILHGAELVGAEALRAYDALIARRAHGTPVAYLTGTREFWSLALTITPDVLVPRPDTEVLVEQALERLPRDRARSVLELGTGSGAIAIAIASERPLASVTATDVSEQAIAVAKVNAHRHGVRVDWRLGSWFEAVRGAAFDMIVANPPYIACGDPTLARLGAEPLLALAAGRSGLDALAAIVGAAASHLRPQGWLLLEHGSAQAGAVAGLLRDQAFTSIRTQIDYSGNPRVTLGTLPSAHQENL